MLSCVTTRKVCYSLTDTGYSHPLIAHKLKRTRNSFRGCLTRYSFDSALSGAHSDMFVFYCSSVVSTCVCQVVSNKLTYLLTYLQITILDVCHSCAAIIAPLLVRC